MTEDFLINPAKKVAPTEVVQVPDANKSKLPRDATVLLDAVLEHRGWDKRAGQVQMVQAISEAIWNKNPNTPVDISTNAPVGTGKSLAYILAALASGKRVLVATSTKSLQDQLIKEELPKLKEDLKAIYDYDLTYGMMKGKSNYPCLATTRAMLNAGDADDLALFDDIEQPDTRDIEQLKAILKRAELAQEAGDVLAYDAEGLMSALRPDTRRQISGSKNCAMQREKWIDPATMRGLTAAMDEGMNINDLDPEIIEEFKQLPRKVSCESRCIYRAAYAHAMDSQVVVVNTTLLAYELIKTDSFAAENSLSPYLLKGIGMIVVDEAHHLFRILAEAFSVELNITKAVELIDDTTKKLTKRYGDDGSAFFNKFRDDIGGIEKTLNLTIDNETDTEREFRENMANVLGALASRTEQFILDLQAFAASRERMASSGLTLDRNGVPKVVSGMAQQISEDITAVAMNLSNQLGAVDSQGRHQFSLNFSDEGQPLVIKTVPIDVSFFRKMVSRASSLPNIYTGDVGMLLPADIVLSSGTITKQTPIAVGMKADKYVDVESPFDPNRVRLYVPKGLGTAKGLGDKAWAKRAWEEFGEAITTLGGRTMILTTSHARCEEFTAIAENALPFDYSVYSQSQKMSKAVLIEQFKRSEKAVLVGTTSFWEGVDIPGDDLNLVVIEKLPFPQPNDPIFKAREEFVKERGGNPFMEVNVDYASVMLAQGTGRLIRATGDIGGIVILDDRALTTRYASAVTSLLPEQWKVTSSRADFFDWIKAIAPDNRNEERLFSEKNPEQWSPIGVGRRATKKRPSLTPR